MNATPTTNEYAADTINVGYGRHLWVFGRKHDLADGAYSPASGHYDNYEAAMQAARDYYDDPDLTEDERARLI